MEHATTNTLKIPTEFTTSSSSPLLKLPGEIRNIIYELVLARTPKLSRSYQFPHWIPSDMLNIFQGVYSIPIPDSRVFANELALLRTSRQLYCEALQVLYKMELRGGVAITVYQPHMKQPCEEHLGPSQRFIDYNVRLERSSGLKTNIWSRKKSPKGQQKDRLCDSSSLSKMKPQVERPWDYTCTYCKHHRVKFSTYPGCDCSRSPRLARIPPLDVIAMARNITITILWSHASGPEVTAKHSIQAFKDLAELKRMMSKIGLLVIRDKHVIGGSTKLRIIVSAPGSMSQAEFLLQQVLDALPEPSRRSSWEDPNDFKRYYPN